MTERTPPSDVVGARRLSHKPEARISLKRSGNAGDPHIYVWLGSAMLGAVWVENEPTEIGDYQATRRIWRTTLDTENRPTLEGAVRHILQDFWRQPAVVQGAAEEVRYFERNDRRG